jgi:hypothetical protein
VSASPSAETRASHRCRCSLSRRTGRRPDLRRRTPVSGVAGRVRGAHGGEHRPGDHPCPADTVVKVSGLPTTGDLTKSDSRPAVSLRSASTLPEVGSLSAQPV